MTYIPLPIHTRSDVNISGDIAINEQLNAGLLTQTVSNTEATLQLALHGS